MIRLGTLAALAAGGATFAYAKKKDVSTKSSAAVATGTGLATGAIVWAIAWLFPLIVIGGAGYYLGKKYYGQKALPPGPSTE